MDYNYQQTQLSKSILAGVFAGLGATLFNLAYDYFYRDISGFTPSQIINVSSIIFGTMLLFTVAGYLHFLLKKFVPYGDAVYIILFAALTALCFYMGTHINRSSDPAEISQFRILFLGIEAVSGLAVAFLIPYLIKHEDVYC